MSTPPKEYVWTAMDCQIHDNLRAGKPCVGSAQCLTSLDGTQHTCYVTPYGLYAREVTPSTAGTVRTDLDLSKTRERNRVLRFHDDGNPANGYWTDAPKLLPDSVKTLGQLIAFLRECDPHKYPAVFYGDTKTAARMLFDYLGNSRYRYAVVRAGFSWSTYSSTPTELPIASVADPHEPERFPSVAIPYVVEWQDTLAGTSAGADEKQKVLWDQIDAMVDKYIGELDKHRGIINDRIALTNRSLSGRLEPVRMLAALRALATATRSNEDGMPTDAGEIEALLGSNDAEDSPGLLPKATKYFMELPVSGGGALIPPATTPAPTPDLAPAVAMPGDPPPATPPPAPRTPPKVDPDFTTDAQADIATSSAKLKNYLYGSDEESLAKWIKAFFGRVVPELNEAEAHQAAKDVLDDAADFGGPDTSRLARAAGGGSPATPPAVIERFNRLTHAMALAHGAFAETDRKAVEELDALGEAPEQSPRSADEVTGTSAGGAFLSLGTSFLSVATNAWGNTAGPVTLHVAMAESRTIRDFKALAPAFDPEKVAEFEKTVADRLGKLLFQEEKITADALRKALGEGDEKEIDRLVRSLANKHAGDINRNHLCDGACLLLQLFAVAGAFVTAAEGQDEKPFFFRVCDVIGASAQLGTFVVGTEEAIIQLLKKEKRVILSKWFGKIDFAAIDESEKLLEKLGRLGNGFGWVSSVIGVISGVKDCVDALVDTPTHRRTFLEGLDNFSKYETGALNALGSAGMSVVTAAATLGATTATTPWLIPLEVVSLTCLISSGVITFTTAVVDLLAAALTPKTNQLALAIHASVRESLAWGGFEYAHPEVVATMNQLEEACGKRLPYASAKKADVALSLQSAGVPDEWIPLVCPDTSTSTGGSSSSTGSVPGNDGGGGAGNH